MQVELSDLQFIQS